jgi:hypothetical protein
MTMDILQADYDSGIKKTGSHNVTIKSVSDSAYCLVADGKDSTTKFYFSGPGGEVSATAC